VVGNEIRRADALSGGDDGAPSFPAQPLLDALAATKVDGAPRHVILGDASAPTLEAEICRDEAGHLIVELPVGATNESEALRRLARQMAGEPDTPSLLAILCAAGAEQCAGTGGAVLKVVGNEGEVVAAVGGPLIALGKRFELPGSLMREVLRTRDVASVADFSNSSRPLTRVVPELHVGPMLLAPLIAQETIIGVLAVTRDSGAPAFSTREAHRLRAIADYAALALRKAELLEQAQIADRAKSRFLATVSHELRTPLTALAGYEELLADQVLGPLSENQLDVLERMRSVTQHLASVIEEVLAFSSLDEGRETMRPTDFLAADLVRATAAVIEPLAQQKHLAFEYHVPSAPVRMTSDVDKVRQILVNLAGNAVKFTDTGFVRLDLEAGERCIQFIVRDSGIGIAAADLARLFQPFAQVDTGLTRRHGGTGLGLYIARSLAELLGGRLDVESSPGVGSSFTLTLPADL